MNYFGKGSILGGEMGRGGWGEGGTGPSQFFVTAPLYTHLFGVIPPCAVSSGLPGKVIGQTSVSTINDDLNNDGGVLTFDQLVPRH